MTSIPEGAILLPDQFAVLVHDDAFRMRYQDVDAVDGVYGGILSKRRIRVKLKVASDSGPVR